VAIILGQEIKAVRSFAAFLQAAEPAVSIGRQSEGWLKSVKQPRPAAQPPTASGSGQLRWGILGWPHVEDFGWPPGIWHGTMNEIEQESLGSSPLRWRIPVAGKLAHPRSPALQSLKEVLVRHFGDVRLLVFGSAARGTMRLDSDIDVLVLLPGKATIDVEETVHRLAYSVELAQGVVFGLVVYGRDDWDQPPLSGIPLHEVIECEGVPV
jgi:predicted nucleotidyltransferase